MDFRRLERALKQSDEQGNATEPFNLTTLSPNILDALIPGYSLISRLAPLIFGFDIAVILPFGLLCFAVVAGARYLWRYIYVFLRSTWMCYIIINGQDNLFGDVLEWVNEQNMTKVSRRLIAVTANPKPEDDDAPEEFLSEDGLFHFGKWAAKKPPKYEPAVGSHWFWFNGRFFIFERSIKEHRTTPYQTVEEHAITVRCMGRSTQPLKEWIEHVKRQSVEKHTSLTTIWRPTGLASRRSPGSWHALTSRPSRPMQTVILEKEQKTRLISDVNEYLHPATPKWYATRGLPYRRGYLFYGPPGTGKSSLSFALAGLFGLDIHVISLNEQGLSAIGENELNMLFNNLPRRCIVLLEDIDAAGLARDSQSDASQGDTKTARSQKETSKNDIRDLAEELGRQRKKADPANQAISLSGLLNAIDGVATQEGRILVMTTNHPEKLDKALIRPGRVDMQIKFTLATKHQAREIFLRMYGEGDDSVANAACQLEMLCEQQQRQNEKPRAVRPKSVLELKLNDAVNGLTPPPSPIVPSAKTPTPFAYLDIEPEPALTPVALAELADQFADKIPESTLSPAEIQSFLIIRKRRPRKALTEVADWCDELVRVKREGGKLFEMQ